MNETLKVKSSLTLRSRRRLVATPPVQPRIVPSDSAPYSGASLRRRSTQRPSETVTSRPRSTRGRRRIVREAARRRSRLQTVPDDDLTNMTVSDTPPSNRSRQLSAGRVCAVCRVSSRRCQCPELPICPLSYLCRRQPPVTDAASEPVRRTSRGQRDTVPGVTPVTSRRRERGTVTGIASANPTSRSGTRRPEVATARPRRHTMRAPANSQHSMILRDPTAVELSSMELIEGGFFSTTPHLNDLANRSLQEWRNRARDISRYFRSTRGFVGIVPFPAPQWFMDLIDPMGRAFLDFVTQGSGGMANEEICRLPVRKIPNSAISLQPCVICLKDYERGDVLRVMPCHHEFHQKCLDQWLAIKRNCPVCRNVL